jgi:peroxiredoxin
MQSPAHAAARLRSCAFRDHAAELAALGARLFGLSTQHTTYQQEMVERLHLPFEVLSDAELSFTTSLRLPTFEVCGMRLIKRLTLIVNEIRIEHVFYPVFPPNESASDVVRWLRRARGS